MIPSTTLQKLNLPKPTKTPKNFLARPKRVSENSHTHIKHSKPIETPINSFETNPFPCTHTTERLEREILISTSKAKHRQEKPSMWWWPTFFVAKQGGSTMFTSLALSLHVFSALHNLHLNSMLFDFLFANSLTTLTTLFLLPRDLVI